jgi:hypothetical protein
MLVVDVIGVAGTEKPGARRLPEARAASGVGAPICVFLGVSSVEAFIRDDELEARRLLDELTGIEATGGGRRRLTVTKGCRKAFWGLRRRSGSQ